MPVPEPRPPPPVPPPAVAPGDPQQVARRQLRQALVGNARGLAVALAVHLAAVLGLSRLPAEPPGPPAELRVVSVRAEEEAPEPEIAPAPLERQPLEPPREVQEPEVAAFASFRPDSGSSSRLEGLPGPGQNVIGAGGGGLGGGSGGGGVRAVDAGVPGGALGGGGVDLSAFERFVEELRGRGLDVVFVVDASASMGQVIAQACATIDDVVADLASVVPSLRLGIVAYRDRTDAWTTRTLDLDGDRFAVHNFLLDLTAEGGGDFEEAVDAALAEAAAFAWRPGARRVILLVGDAPMHPDDRATAVRTVRQFAVDRHSVVNVLYSGTLQPVDGTQGAEARARLEELAREGEGHIFDLLAGDRELHRLVVEATFGPEWYADVSSLLSRDREDRRTRIVADKVAAADRPWLVAQLGREPLHPAVVEGCVQLFDFSIARAAQGLVADESRPTPTRSGALHVLKRALGVPVQVDIGRPLAEQEAALLVLAARVEALQPAVSGGHVAPPPPPQGGVSWPR